MYNHKLVAAIKSKGKILREFGEAVYVPFGTEYSILLKNLHDRRVVARVYIDGEDVTAGGLVIGPRKEINFERSLANGSMSKGNKFKFIERSGAVEEHRGIKLEDGLIRVEYEFEEKLPQRTFTTTTTTYPYLYPYDDKYWFYNDNDTALRGMHFGATAGDVNVNNAFTSSTATASAGASSAKSSKKMSNDFGGKLKSAKPRSVTASAEVEVQTAGGLCSPVQNETGVTVAGGKSNQKFTVSGWFPTESTTHTIVLNLFGETEDNKLIREPITTKAKQECSSCGHQNKMKSKFCSECGTALEIFA